MARNVEHFSHPNVMDMDSFLLNGVQRLAFHYAGCQKCPSTWESEPFFEMSIKERKRYPLCNIIHQNSSRNNHSSRSESHSLADQLKHLEDQLKVSSTNDCQTQYSDKPDVHELEKIVSKLEMYTSSFKSKLRSYKENVSNISEAKTVKEKHVLSFGLDPPSPSENASVFIHSLSSSESSDEVIEENEGNEELIQDSVKITSTTKIVREEYMQCSASDSSHPKDHNANTSIHSKSAPETNDDKINEVRKENEKLVQEIPDLRMEQSPISCCDDSSGSSSLHCDDEVEHGYLQSCETDKGNSESTLAESEMQSDSNRSSNFKQEKTTNINVSHGKKDKLKKRKSKKRIVSDSEEQQSSEKQKCPTSKKASFSDTFSEFYEERRKRRRLVESENADLSLYKTAKETISQASETMEGYSSESATP